IGLTRFTNVTMGALLAPDLSGVSDNPEQLTSLRHQLPEVLIEQGLSQGQTTAGIPLMTLHEGSPNGGSGPYDVRLLTASDLAFQASWVINALPDSFGLEHFTNRGGGSITVPGAILRTAVAGSRIVWTEYMHG